MSGSHPQVAVDQFLEILRVEKQYSEHTLSNYQRDLYQWLNYMEESQEESSLKLGELSVSVCKAYLYALSDLGYQAKSIARKIAALRSFWNTLIKKGKWQANPWEKVTIPKINQKLPELIPTEELHAFLDAINKDTPSSLRDRAMFEMMYGTGIRVSECVGLTCESIDLNEHECWVMGKRKKERLVFFGDPVKQALERYIRHGRPVLKPKSDHMFVNKKGEPITTRSVQRILKKYGVEWGLSKPITPHTLRHACATSLLNQGVSIKMIQDLLGHENLSSTQIYTHLSKERLMSVYQSAHPRA